MPTCDIVIPTYNSADVLPYTLRALFNQPIPQNWAVCLIISDDGSSDTTLATLKQHLAPSSWLPTITVTGPHTGVAGARNRGLAVARADIILLLGADIIITVGTLAAHLNFHAAHPHKLEGALGMIKWDPRLPPTPFMEWMVHGGPQNNFDALLGQTTADPAHFFYGSHISFKKSLLPAPPFPETYYSYGWEDTDLGRHLASRGFTLHVLHNTLALHRHYYTVEDIRRRQYHVGRNLLVYQKRYPNTELLPQRTICQKIKYQILTVTPLAIFLHWLLAHTAHVFSTPWLFSQITRADFWRGVQASNRLSP